MTKYTNKKYVAWFESEQKQYGTAVAIHNLVFLIADDILKSVGCKKLTVTHKLKTKR